MHKVNDLIENIDNENHNGDYTAININDIQGKISLCGVGGSDDDLPQVRHIEWFGPGGGVESVPGQIWPFLMTTDGEQILL